MKNLLKKILGKEISALTSVSENDTVSESIQSITMLLIAVVQQDDLILDEEIDVVKKVLSSYAQLNEVQLDILIQNAISTSHQSNDFFQHTKQIVSEYNQKERIDLMESLWRVAMADGEVDPHEEQLLRRLAELLGVHHHQFIQAKQRART